MANEYYRLDRPGDIESWIGNLNLLTTEKESLARVGRKSETHSAV